MCALVPHGGADGYLRQSTRRAWNLTGFQEHARPRENGSVLNPETFPPRITGIQNLDRFSESEPPSSIEVNAFHREQCALAGQAQTKPTNAGARDNTMTGDDHGDGIASDGSTDGACGIW